MQFSPFQLEHNEIACLRSIRDGHGLIDVDHNNISVDIIWSDDVGSRITIASGNTEAAAQEILAERLAALSIYEELVDEADVLPLRYRDLIEAVRRLAEERGIETAELDDVAFIREWERNSEFSAASWLTPHEDDVERLLESQTSYRL